MRAWYTAGAAAGGLTAKAAAPANKPNATVSKELRANIAERERAVGARDTELEGMGSKTGLGSRFDVSAGWEGNLEG